MQFTGEKCDYSIFFNISSDCCNLRQNMATEIFRRQHRYIYTFLLACQLNVTRDSLRIYSVAREYQRGK